ncbi:MAG: KEOPS complex subunit Pcc1 [Candidatus Nanoarchaeia archaeon]
MNYKLEFEIRNDTDNIMKLLLVDLENIKGDRSKITTKKEDNKLKVLIESMDATALRAAINNVLKILQIYEKSKGMKNE